MPELPEVETIRLGLQKYVVGCKISDVEVRAPGIFEGNIKDIVGSKVTGVRRLGKGLIIDLNNGYSLAIHIKLTGQLIYRDEKVSKVSTVSRGKVGESLPNKFTHVIFKFKIQNSQRRGSPRLRSASKATSESRDAFLYYNDVRRFGWIKVIRTDEVLHLPFFKNMGPEPMINMIKVRKVSKVSEVPKGERILTLDKFRKILGQSNTAVKPLIMDQKKIGGIGNIYANDALYLAGISPKRPAKSLSDTEIKELYKAVHKVLEKGLKYGGSSELNYVNALGQEGQYQNHTLVYGKQGQICAKPACRRAGIRLEKIYLGGRGTYFCPSCQR